MDPILISVAAAVASIGTIVAAARHMKKLKAKLQAAWTTAAEAVGGTFTPAENKFWKPAPNRVRATIEPGVDVLVDHFTVSTGKSSITYTRIVAAAPSARSLRIKLTAEGVMASVGKALGMDDLELGDPPFDQRFLVRTNDDALARAWLAEPARRAILAVGTSYSLTLDAGQVKSQRVGLELESGALLAAMHGVAALAGGGIVLAEAWRRLAAELGGKLDQFVPGEARFEGELDGRQLSVEITADGVRLRRQLGIRDAPKLELTKGEPLPAQLFPSGASWQSLQPATLTCDGESVTLAWAGYVPDAERFRAAARLLVSAETGSLR